AYGLLGTPQERLVADLVDRVEVGIGCFRRHDATREATTNLATSGVRLADIEIGVLGDLPALPSVVRFYEIPELVAEASQVEFIPAAAHADLASEVPRRLGLECRIADHRVERFGVDELRILLGERRRAEAVRDPDLGVVATGVVPGEPDARGH